MNTVSSAKTRFLSARHEGCFPDPGYCAALLSPREVFCDIEGDELKLLNPQRYPALKQLDIIVECHDVFDASITTNLQEHFADSHQITRNDVFS